ncbi:zinc finger protein interacting with ribonucleoprotein K-like isoform X4 [Athalia rosae]|uniref:zinc finger protein interacting with ribonucleoprotein K-like isoform X4 n=1 Tax=Athalia rosae TaxID=37344 RepID=UPI002034973A|nr:zinc finger protein interacting with ribonucleoprotein K-like isoform X4 [Athalia rosae]
MSSIPHDYEMEAGSSEILAACDESEMLIEAVDNIEEENSNQGEKYYVITEVHEEPVNLVDAAEGKQFEAANTTEQNQSWNELCRVCANSSDHLIPIFEGEGLEHDLSSKIHRYLPIQVSREDSLPSHLCYHCASTLLAWHELTESCIDAEQRLLKMKKDLQEKEQTVTLEDSLNEKSAAPPSADSNQITKTQMPAEGLRVKGESNEESKTNDSERFTHYIQFPRLPSLSDFRRAYQALLQYYQKEIKPLEQTLPKNVENSQWLDLTSLDNGTSCSSPVDLNSGTQLSEKRIIPAITIEENVNSAASGRHSLPNIINTLVVTETSDEEVVDQKYDSMTDENPLSLELPTEPKSSNEKSESTKLEAQTATTKTMYDCKLCNKKFQRQESFHVHMQSHNDAKRFTCHICGKQFGQTGSLYYHLKHVHGGVKQHACDLCGRSFAMKAAMEDHRRIHTGERPYCCASCGKTFKTKASLYIHSKTHTDELPHKCSYCSKAFRWKQQMLGHLTIHTGQKNHICEICGKRFGVKNDLTRHKRIHSEEKPFTCQQCGLSFGQKRYLKNHERTRHT